MRRVSIRGVIFGRHSLYFDITSDRAETGGGIGENRGDFCFRNCLQGRFLVQNNSAVGGIWSCHLWFSQ